MLKIKNIKFTDTTGRVLSIHKNHIESFPLVGGEPANMLTTKSWNQHGNTPINALMDAYEGDLVFIIRTSQMQPEEIAEERRRITNICNPLNGVVKMTITLNDDSVFNRDITFVSAPVFPIGLENRNREWQKVQLLFSANNPFWYSESEILETFQGVEPLVSFPFTITGRTVFDDVKLNYEGKVQGSVVENPNVAFSSTQSSIPTSYETMGTELTPNSYEAISYDKAIYHYTTTSTSGNMAMCVFKYNVVEMLERKYGDGIWNGATDLATKVQIANDLIGQMTWYVNGYGTNAMTIGIIKDDFTNFSIEYTDTDFTLRGINSSATNNIHSDGCTYFMAHTDASDGTERRINVNYAYFLMDLTFATNGEPFIFGNVIPSKITLNEGQVEAPVVIKIQGACVNPRIENETTGEFIAFKDLSMNAGDELVIDTTFGQKKVELNGENVFNKLDFASTFFNLEIGENSIDFSDETGTKETNIHFIYRNLYITL